MYLNDIHHIVYTRFHSIIMAEKIIAADTSLEMDDGKHDDENSKRSTTHLLSRSLSKVSNVTYDTKKNMAQGMMDIALLTANANQLRYILEFRGVNSTNFVLLLVLIACSLILQVGTVILSILHLIRCYIKAGKLRRYLLEKQRMCKNSVEF